MEINRTKSMCVLYQVLSCREQRAMHSRVLQAGKGKSEGARTEAERTGRRLRLKNLGVHGSERG
jgi:hypothetical protein